MVMGVEVRLPVSEGVHRTVLSKEETMATHNAPCARRGGRRATCSAAAPRTTSSARCFMFVREYAGVRLWFGSGSGFRIRGTDAPT